jgi:hypothetical protein
MEGRGNGRALENGSPAGTVDIRDGQRRLHPDVPEGVDPSKKLERGPIASEQHVLPVVHELTGFAIGKGGCPSAKLGPGVEDQHAHAARGERRPGAQSREAASDNHHRA